MQIETHIKNEAKDLFNKIYEPLERMYHGLDDAKMRKYAKITVIEVVAHFLAKMPEGSANWLHHRKLIEAINNL